MTVPTEKLSKERRRSQIICNLEATLHRITADLANRMDLSMSEYVRGLIIKDLRERGLLPDSIIARLFLRQ